MKAYLKYCGGCNPLYDRSMIRDLLSADFPCVTFTREAGEAECAVVICGCSRACAEIAQEYCGEKAEYVTSLKDYEEVKRKWKEM